MAIINVGEAQPSGFTQALGILGGLGEGLARLRAEKEKRDLDTLKLLSANERYELGPATDAQLSPLGELLTGGVRYRPTAEGFPVVDVGGTPFTVRTKTPLDLETLARRAASDTPSVAGPPTAPSAPSLTPAGEVIPPSSPLYAGQPITQGPLPSAGTAATPPAPAARWQGAAAAGLPPLPEVPSLQVVPADIAAHGPLRVAVDAYNASPTAVNMAAVRKAYAEAPDQIRAARRQQYQTDVETYKLAVSQREAARKASQIPDYGLGTERNALMHSLYGEELTRTGQPPSQAQVAAVDRALAQRPLTAAEDKLRMEQRIKAENVKAAMAEVDAILSGRQEVGGLSVEQAALTALRARGLTLQDVPELHQRLALHKPFTTAAERTNFVDARTYSTPSVRSLAEADQKGLTQLSREDAQSFRQGNVLYAKLQRAQETLQQLIDSDPRFQSLRHVTGLDERVAEGLLVTAVRAAQDNPLVKQLQSDLQEMAISYGMYVSGLKGRPAQAILERTTADLPNLDTSLFQVRGGSNWLETALRTALSTHLPDLPRSILGQLEMMKDVVRSVQESTLESSGALTAEESATRRHQRMQRILEFTQQPTGVPGRVPPDASGSGPLDAARGLGNAVAPGLQRLESDLAEDLRPTLERRRGGSPAQSGPPAPVPGALTPGQSYTPPAPGAPTPGPGPQSRLGQPP